MPEEAKDDDLTQLINLLSEDIAADYRLDARFFRGSVEDVLVALSARGVDLDYIRTAIEQHSQQSKKGTGG